MEKTIRILYVEDVPSDAELVIQEISRGGIFFTHTLVDSKKNYIEALTAIVPDIIISDYYLIQFDGMEALSLRNEIAPLTPFILVTGSVNEEVAVECMKAGADDYILKERLTRLVPAIKEALKKKAFYDSKVNAEKALMESERVFSSFLDYCPVYFFFKDDEAKPIRLSKNFNELIGCPSEDAVGKSMYELFPVDLAKKMIDDDLNVIRNNVPVKVIEELSGRIYETTKFPIVQQGKSSFLAGFTVDVTEKVRAEEALRESEQRFKQIAEIAGEWIWEVDQNGLYTYISKMGEIILGYSAFEIIGKKHFYDFFDPSIKEEFKKTALAAFSRKESFKNFENLNVHKDGHSILLETTGVPMLDESGGLLGYRGVDTDITNRKREANELNETKERFRSVFENTLIGLYRTTPDGKIVMANPTLINMLGFSSFEELVNRNLEDTGFEPSYPRSEFKELIEKNGVVEGLEAVWVKKDGTSVYFSENALAIKDEKGKILFYEGSIENITARKVAEKDLQLERNLLRTLIDNLPDLISIKDHNGRYILNNRQHMLSVGVKNQSEVVGKTTFDFFPAEDAIVYNKDDKNVIFSGQPLLDKEECLTPADKSYLCWYLTSKIPIKDSHEKVSHLISISHDITERKKAEELIQHERIMLRTLIDHIPDLIYIKDAECRKVIANLADLENIGASTEAEVIGKTDKELFPGEVGERGYNDDIAVIRMGKRIMNLEEDFCDSQGSKRWLLTSKLPLLDVHGRIIGLVGIGRDITRSKQAALELIKSKEKAEESDRLKTAFLHNISHEIRTPMNAIIGFSSLLREPDLQSNDMIKFIDIICQSSNQLLSIISDIVSISTIEAGQEHINYKEFNLNHMLNSVYQQFRLKSSDLNIPLGYEPILPDEEVNMLSDETKIIQILTNLLNNAFKFTPKGRIEFGYSQKGDYLEFFVKDSGIGISEEFKGLIFERFYQVESTLSRKAGGTGLGLSLSKAYVELLGGKIWVESSVDEGSVFYFTIPYRKSEASKVQNSLLINESDLLSDDIKTILIAEDEDTNFMLLKLLIKEFKFNILRALNGKEAIEIFKLNKDIKLVLMDLKMPVIDGYEATRVIKEIRPDIHVIAITALAQDFDRIKALDCGCSDYLAKPYRKADLLMKLKKYLE